MKKLLFCFLFSMPLSFLWAEDIELYIGNETQRSGDRPQVLIIFDTSGSMAQEEIIKESYDPNVSYPGNNGFVYYSYTSSVPSLTSTWRFLSSDNGCNTSKSILNTNGFYTGRARYYRPATNRSSASWRNLSGALSSASGHFIDCEDDVINNDLKNADGVPDGLPSNDNFNIQNPPPYNVSPSSSPSFNFGIRFFSSNYVAWYNTTEEIRKTRLQVAQETVVSLIESAPGVSFGLEVFNQNNSSLTNGGRISYGIRDEDNYDANTLINLVNNELSANGNTPLCESLYEASRYLGGKSLVYGNSGGSKIPARDDNIIDNNTYISPYAGCSNEIFIILITDGEPTQDTSADSLVNALNPGGNGNRLDELAEWMHTNDINDSLDGTQIATIYTIGFGEDAVNDAGELLNLTATKGGGTYYPANDPGDLLAALNDTLLEILEVSTSFTSPSIASNNFDRTETLDSVYYAMFLPSEGARWTGNLKKLRISGDQQLDRTGVLAIDENGNIKDDARTFWSTSNEADGPEVGEGGVVEMLRNKSNRLLFSDMGSGNALVEFNYANALTWSGDSASLAVDMATSEDELESHFKWASGFDVDDDDSDLSTTDVRQDIFGDPLHSKPLVVNYGGTQDNQDIRILVGTNSGFVHMFKDLGDTVDETWAFIPNELFENIPVLRNNSSSADKVYGIDGTPTVHLLDNNGDGSINATDGDKAWLYFGLRRGGRSFYAIDISNPDLPRFMWRIDEQSSGFSELGQSWARIKVGFSRINIVNGEAKPVAIFSAGYDTNKDTNGLGSSDAIGRGVYVADAETGQLLWSATPAATSGVNLQWSHIEDSIPGSLATMDSDSDGFIDRLYTGDTGGNVWRIDMPGDDPFGANSPWTIHKLGAFGDNSNFVNDRRFFNEPTIARAIITDTVQTETTVDGLVEVTVSRFERNYDAVLLGSGDRTSPTSTDTNDKFFMMKDPDIITRSFGFDGHNIPATITLNDLYDFTDNPYGNTLSTQARESLDLAVSAASGWHIDYIDSGEKSVSSATVISGVAYFNSFTPAVLSNENTCSLSAGVGRLYAVDLSQGSNIYNFRRLDVGDRVPDTPTIVIPSEEPTEDTNGDGVIDSNDRADTGRLRFVGVGSGVDENGNPGDGTITLCNATDCNPNEGITLQTTRTNLYIQESN